MSIVQKCQVKLIHHKVRGEMWIHCTCFLIKPCVVWQEHPFSGHGFSDLNQFSFMRMNIKPSSEHFILVVSTRAEDFWKQKFQTYSTVKYWSTQWYFFKINTTTYFVFHNSFIQWQLDSHVLVFLFSGQVCQVCSKAHRKLNVLSRMQSPFSAEKEEFLIPLLNCNSNTVFCHECFTVEKAIKNQ